MVRKTATTETPAAHATPVAVSMAMDLMHPATKGKDFVSKKEPVRQHVILKAAVISACG